MADVLSLLKEYHLNGKPIIETQSEVIFGDFAWPKTTKTNFLVWGSGKEGTPKDYYTLDCVVYLLRHIDLPHTQYVRQAASAGLPVVRLPDRRDLLAYLKGETTTAPNIDRAAPVDISLRRIVTKQVDTHLHIRRDGSDLLGPDGFGIDPDAKRMRLAGSVDGLDEGLLSRESQGRQKPAVLDEEAIARDKRDLAAKLESSFGNRSSSFIQSDQVKSSTLPEAVPLDKIQSWRAKFRAIQQQRIKTGDTDQTLEVPITNYPDQGDVSLSNLSSLDTRDSRVGLHSIVPGGESQSIIRIDDTTHGQLYSGSTLLRASLMADEAPVRAIVSRERRWRTRVSVLQSQAKTFYENIVLGILRNVILKEDSHNAPDAKAAGKLSFIPTSAQPTLFPQPLAVGTYYSKPNSTTNYPNTGSAMTLSTGQPMSVTNSTAQHHSQMHYSRYDQERFAGGREETAGFRIDTMGTYHGKALASMVSVGAAKSNQDNSVASATPVRTPGTVSRSMGSETPSIPYEPQPLRDPRGINSGIPLTPSATPDPYRGLRSTADARLSVRTKVRSSRIPIIIIPAAPTSLITMYNARDILEDLRFIKSQEKQASGMRRENEILIQRHKSDGRTVPYRVVDQPNKLLLDEWNRVVAVFVQGQSWQFKGWPISSDPAVIFSQIKGFHLKYTNMPLDPNVAKWNVRVIDLDQRRHLDKANFQQIWEQLDKHIARNKPFLRS
ncbi:Parafibromin [Schistosoma japonicum]|uniref:Parafibromin n=1 Tax=Schistosoma japonicum TaxID=6182 RepID=A0A4Z2DAQ5_SCHJA|nr:Parafibromin [Schistosoma japonicum]